MNKPVDPASVANENAAEEKKTSIIVEKEENTIVEENVPVKEDLPEEKIEKTVENVEMPEEVKTETPPIEESSQNTETTEVVKEEEACAVEFDKWNKGQIIERLAVTVKQEISDSLKNEVDALKHAFYKIKKTEIDAAKRAFIEAGGSEEAFKAEEKDEVEEKLKDLLSVFREKKAALTAEVEKLKEDNLKIKKAIIEKIKELVDSKDDFYKVSNEFRKLQQQWREIKLIPQSAVNGLWKEYQHCSEKFYDLLKINNEMRDYDFKKNLELKQNLCVAVEKLDEEKDVISAFYQLQKLHQEWREIGPVAREFREEIWDRFKKASSVINKKHQDHFDALRELEQRNLDEKTAICEEIEAIDYSKLIFAREWNEQNKRVLHLQDKWKATGFAPKKYNVKIFERFRATCDVFFQKKTEFYKGLKGLMDENMEKKKSLCEQAEALKDSQDWKEITEKLIDLQKEWKSVGPVSRKQSEAIWKRFISACDYFFEQKNSHFSSQKTEEVENLKKKKEIIAQINAIDVSLPAAETIAQLREYISQFNNTGYVPFREKDKVYKEYRTAIDKHYDRLKIDESERRLQSFKSSVNEQHTGEKSKNKLLNEREKLLRNYERLKSDIQIYENNIGFLSVSSKGGGGLVKEMQGKIENLKNELTLIEKKIDIIDQSLGFNN
ncbi:MAG: DUF349 domain-containing protein [Dysgonamonadaceae bacterium]|jgi:hypothetical protein|nr:DUF349 domain-containing protein [Dysgonamonadaceae bacterium]